MSKREKRFPWRLREGSRE